MRFTARTEYGFVCMAYLASQYTKGNAVSIKQIAEHGHYPVAFTEKILQGLRQAGLVTARHGNQGGYQLARPPKEMTLKSIIDVLEGATFEVFCKPETREHVICAHFCLCGIKPVWQKTKDLLDKFYESITLDTLAKDELEVRKILPGIA